MTINNFTHRTLWLFPVLLLFVGITWLDQNRGGDLDRQMTCILTNSKMSYANDEIIIFGSSRSDTAFDPYYINGIFSNNGLEKDFNIARYALFGRDNLSAYFLLENRIRTGTPPKMIILELMLGSGSIAARDEKLKPRHNSLLSFKQHYAKINDFKRTSQNSKWLDYIRTSIDRSNALLYALIKRPSKTYWNPKGCNKTKDWGRKASPSGEHKALGNAENEVSRAFKELSKNYDVAHAKMTAPKSKWTKRYKKLQRKINRNKNKKPSELSPVYNLDKKFTNREAKDIKKIVKLAKDNNIKVLLLAMPSYHQTVNESETKLLQDFFPEAIIYNIHSEARPTVDAYWKDLNHITKKGSILTSALLGRKIIQELEYD